MSKTFIPLQAQAHKVPCITLVGMPGAGKSTVGALLARELQWGFVDSDHIIEAVYGVPLQSVADAVDKEQFLDIEADVITTLRMYRVVLATGGSVVYRDAAMRHLLAMGPVVHLHVPLAVIEERIARKPDRGLAIAPGQTIQDIFKERQALYQRYAQCRIDAENLSPGDCARAIVDALRADSLMP